MAEWLGRRTGNPGFKYRSDRQLELFLGSSEFNSSAALVLNSLLVCLPSAGIYNHVIFSLNYFFVL